ncbi:hypothetical protein BH11VER1_BH11VER1_27620 [soil metagenome]
MASFNLSKALINHLYKWSVCGLSCVFLSVFTLHTTAAQTPQTDLSLIKTQLRKDLLQALLPEKRQHRDALLSLEQKNAAALDFAGAIKARDERITLEKEIASIEKEIPMLSSRAIALLGRGAPDRLEMHFADAVLRGVQLDPKDGFISGWDKDQASASWKLPDLPPGGYEVLLRYTAENGSVQIKESYYSLKGKLKETKKTPLEEKIGTLRIKDGKGNLTLSSDTPQQNSTLRVYSVVLVPAVR